MWAIDQSDLILIGVLVGLALFVGVLFLVTPSDAPQPVSIVTHPEAPVPPSPAEPLPPQEVPMPAVEPPQIDVSMPESSLPSVPIVDGIIQTGEYAHAMEAGGFRVFWSNDAAILRMGLFSPGTGYVAIGLDPDHRMQGANYIIGTVRDGQVDVRDDYGLGPLTHGADTDHGGVDNILASAGKELNGQTTIEFVIPLDSGDPLDKPLVPGETYEILVAFHASSDTFSTRHSQRGSGEIRLDDPRP